MTVTKEPAVTGSAITDEMIEVASKAAGKRVSRAQLRLIVSAWSGIPLDQLQSALEIMQDKEESVREQITKIQIVMAMRKLTG